MAKMKCFGESEQFTNSETLPIVNIDFSKEYTNTATLPIVNITVDETSTIIIKDGSGTFFVTIDDDDNFSGDYDAAEPHTIDRDTGDIVFTWDDAAATDQPKVVLTNQVGTIFIEDGSGSFLVTIDIDDIFGGDYDSSEPHTIDRDTGEIVFTWDDASATDQPQIILPEDCDEPVMGLKNFIEPTGDRQLVGMNTLYVNKYHDSNRSFSPMQFSQNWPTNTFTGDEFNFFSATNYPDKDENPRLVFVNNVDPPGFVKLLDESLIVYNFINTTDNPDYQDVDSTLFGTFQTAQHVYYVNERIVFLKPTISNKVYTTGYLFSAIKDSSGAGDKLNSPGAGLQIIPDETPITGSTQMGDKIIVWTEQNVWEISTTQNFDLPFFHKKVADADFQMSSAPYGTINWQNLAHAFGFWGLFQTDGNKSQRFDQKIPLFTRDDVQADILKIVNAGIVMESSQLWWSYPSVDQINSENFSDKVLAYNFEEKSFSKYKLPLTTFGFHRDTNLIAWDDVNENYGEEYERWAEWDTTTEPWSSFFWQSGTFNSIAGDKNGNVFWLERGDIDECFTITAITKGSTTTLTIPGHIFVKGDNILIHGVTSVDEDMEELLNQQVFRVSSVNGDDVTIPIDTSEVSDYENGGYACLLIDVVIKTVPINPFVEDNKQCNLHKLWFFISTGTDNWSLDLFTDRREAPYRTDIIIDASNSRGGSTKKWVPITVNQTAQFHTIRLRQEAVRNPGRIHAMGILASPVGRIF